MYILVSTILSEDKLSIQKGILMNSMTQPGARHSTAPRPRDLSSAALPVLHDVADTEALSEQHTTRVREWAEQARRTFPNGVIVMAATRASAPSTRIDLLRTLRDHIAPGSFVRERVRYSVDPLPSWTADPAIALKVISAAQAELEVRSICSLLADADFTGGAPCSNAS